MDLKWLLIAGVIVGVLGFSVFALVPTTKVETKIDRNIMDEKTEQALAPQNFTLSDIPNEPKSEEYFLDYEILDESFKTQYDVIEIQDLETNLKIMISAGEKKTGGYNISINEVFKNDNNIIIDAFLEIPKGPVTQAFTYPSKVISIDKQKIEAGEWNIIVVLTDSNKNKEVHYKTIKIN